MLSVPEDRKIFHVLLRRMRRQKFSSNNIGQLLIDIGSYFLETPFAPHTLEQRIKERLVINLRQMDCFTFVENTMVLARLIRTGMATWHDFAAELQFIRYRQGRRNGYASRLHYFSDWLAESQAKGFLQDMTQAIGGQRFFKNFSFMTIHRDNYPALHSSEQYRLMVRVEQNCSRRSLHHIPKALLPECAANIINGDLIAITTGIKGLDVSHVGLAIYRKRYLHLLHASRKAGRVIVSPETLYRYLQRRQSHMGIMVARML